MSRKKTPVVLEIPEELQLTDAEAEALRESIRVQVANILRDKKPAPGDDDDWIQTSRSRKKKPRPKKSPAPKRKAS